MTTIVSIYRTSGEDREAPAGPARLSAREARALAQRLGEPDGPHGATVGPLIAFAQSGAIVGQYQRYGQSVAYDLRYVLNAMLPFSQQPWTERDAQVGALLDFCNAAERTPPAFTSDWLARRRHGPAPVISDADAQRIASGWAVPGTPDALHALAQTGAIRGRSRWSSATVEHDTTTIHGTEDAIAALLRAVAPDVLAEDLRALKDYVRYHGERGPVGGWPGPPLPPSQAAGRARA